MNFMCKYYDLKFNDLTSKINRKMIWNYYV